MTSDGFEATITPEWVGNTVLPRKHNFVTLEMMPEQWRNEADPRVRMELEKRFRWLNKRHQGIYQTVEDMDVEQGSERARSLPAQLGMTPVVHLAPKLTDMYMT